MKTCKKTRTIRSEGRVWIWDSTRKRYELKRLKELCKCGECPFCKANLNIHYDLLEDEE